MFEKNISTYGLGMLLDASEYFWVSMQKKTIITAFITAITFCVSNTEYVAVIFKRLCHFHGNRNTFATEYRLTDTWSNHTH